MSDLEMALSMIKSCAPRYQLWADYYAGRHQLRFATANWKSAFGDTFRAFADNLCPACIDAVADRLVVTGFTVQAGDETAGDTAWSIWERNRMAVDAGMVHQEALTTGDSYVIVWPNPEGEATIYPQEAGQVTCCYDEERPGRMLWAAKCWVNRQHYARVNLYYPDRIEKWVSVNRAENGVPSAATAYVPWPDEPWVANPWNLVPVFHFANAAAIGRCGVSELVNVRPLQDALNKSVLDMLVGMEFQAFPQRYITGIEVEIDAVTGKPVAPFVPGADRIWAIPDEGAKFGQFEAADLTQYLEVQNGFRMEIARVSGTPLHYIMLLSGTPPSGEALKTLEARLVKKCQDRSAMFGATWEGALELALQMESEAGQDTRLQAAWADPAPQSSREQAEIAEIKERVGVSLEIILKELGYSEQDVAEMLAAKEAAQAKALAMMQQAGPAAMPTDPSADFRQRFQERSRQRRAMAENGTSG